MPNTNEPKDGDFASYLEGFTSWKNGIGLELNADRGSARPPERKPGRQTIQHVLVEAQEPTTEFLEEFQALNEAPDLSDEELERRRYWHKAMTGMYKRPGEPAVNQRLIWPANTDPQLQGAASPPNVVGPAFSR